LVLFFILIYAATFSLFTVNKHYNFNTFAWDLGIYHQSLWSTVRHARLLYYTCELRLVESGCFFGVHFCPIIFSIVPLYCLFSSPVTLLVLQSFILGSAAYPIYKIGSSMHNSMFGLVSAAVFLVNPVVHGINGYDFHIQSFIPLLVFGSYYFLLNGRWLPFLLTACLCLTVEEHMVYVLVFYGFSIILDTLVKRREGSVFGKPLRPALLTPLILILISLCWQYLAGNVIGLYNPDMPGVLKAGRHFSVLGVDEPKNIPLYLASHPVRAFPSMFYDFHEKAYYLLHLFFPFLFLSLKSPTLLLPTLPWMVVSVLSNYKPYYSIGFQYPCYVVPFITISSMVGLSNALSSHHGRRKKAPFRFFRLLLALNLCYSAAFTPLNPLVSLVPSPAYQTGSSRDHVERLNRVIDSIPVDASVLTQDNLFPHISSRPEAYVIAPPILFGSSDPAPSVMDSMGHRARYILLDLLTDPHDVSRCVVEAAPRNGYTLIYSEDGVHLFELSCFRTRAAGVTQN